MVKWEVMRVGGNNRTHYLLFDGSLCGIKFNDNTMHRVANSVGVSCLKCQKYYSRMKKEKK